jgi:hypothetical protein
MTTTSKQFELTLAHQAMFSVSDAAGVQIACREGCLWVTLDGDPRDIVLDAGESFQAAEHRHALIYALAPSCLSLAMAPSVAPVRRAGRAHAAAGAQVTFALQPA